MEEESRGKDETKKERKTGMGAVQEDEIINKVLREKKKKLRGRWRRAEYKQRERQYKRILSFSLGLA